MTANPRSWDHPGGVDLLLSVDQLDEASLVLIRCRMEPAMAHHLGTLLSLVGTFTAVGVSIWVVLRSRKDPDA